MTYFPSLSILNSHMFSRAFEQSHVFPRFLTAKCFPALRASSMFTPRVVPVTSCPTLYITCHVLHVFADPFLNELRLFEHVTFRHFTDVRNRVQ